MVRFNYHCQQPNKLSRQNNIPSNPTTLQHFFFFPLLTACSSLKQLFQIHAQIITHGLHQNSHLNHKIMQHCTSYDHTALHHPRLIINHSKNSEPSTCNTLIRAYTSSSSHCGSAMCGFLAMRRSGSKPNDHTYPFVLKACASILGLNEGCQVHGDVVKHGFSSNVYVQNSLINLYGSCQKMHDAFKVFDEMSYRTVVSWNTVLSACVKCSWFGKSTEVFFKMRDHGCDPDETTMVTMLSVCVELGNLSFGKWIHSQVIVRSMVVNTQLGTALVDMYGKCGAVEYGRAVFYRMVDRNVWTWSTMILGFAQHGLAANALRLFAEMKNHHVKPNYVTFLGVLSACSHAGLVEDGQCFFKEMEQVHGIKPMMVHYGVMVDILGRAGRLIEAYAFVVNMPFPADAVVWRTLLSACSIHDGNNYTGIGKQVGQRLLEMEPRRTGNFVMVANKYAEMGLWEKAIHLRGSMRDRGLKKPAGESCLELGGLLFRFFSGDDSFVGFDEIFLLLNSLDLHVKMIDNDFLY